MKFLKEKKVNQKIKKKIFGVFDWKNLKVFINNM